MDAKPARPPANRPVAPQTFVKGGTTSSRHDAAIARQRAETAKRRAQTDAMRRTAKERPDEARLYNRSLSGNSHVVLEVRNKDGSTWNWLVCDLSAAPKDGGGVELTLVIVCPECALNRGIPQGEAQITLRQSNRMFSLDDKKRGQPWVNPDDSSEVYVLAGTITTHETCSCPVCSTRFRIDDSVWRRV